MRIRRDNTAASIFGGTDWHNRRQDSAGNRTTIREIASGLSTNPTFFKLRKGEAVLDSVRMSPRFFSTGHFRSDGVTQRSAVDGGCTTRCGCRTTCRSPSATAAGTANYALGSEGRFYSKMDFPHRPKDYQVLDTTITIRQLGDAEFDLAFDVDGPATSLTIELCFRSGGSLTGVVPGQRRRQLPARRGRGCLHGRRRTRSPSVRATAAASSSRSPWIPARSTPTWAAVWCRPGNVCTSPVRCLSDTRFVCANASFAGDPPAIHAAEVRRFPSGVRVGQFEPLFQ